MRMRYLLLLTCALLLAACQGAPTVVFIVVTPTPGEAEIAREATRDAAETLVVQAGLVPAATATAPEAIAAVPTETPTAAATAATASAPVTAGSTATPLPPNFPTPVIAQITVAEQLFEGGRMFWIQPTGQIWLMIVSEEGRGTWAIYADDYQDTEPAIDASLVPPEGRYQPERGFGKLWRESDDIRAALGWGVTPEFGYVSRYEYRAGGSVDPATGNYTPGPGVHILYSLGGELFRFNEADSTWQLGDS